jgi:ketosteroid isomerase-like protein
MDRTDADGSATTSAGPLEELLDREAIRCLLYRFCRAIDRRDAELLATVYWDDASEWHGAYRGPAAGFRELATGGPGGFEVMRHTLGTINVDLAGDHASSEAYFVASGVPRAHHGEPRMLRVHEGRYLDELERRGGEWRIVHRTVVKDFIELRPLTEADEPEYAVARPDREDRVYHPRQAVTSRRAKTNAATAPASTA